MNSSSSNLKKTASDNKTKRSFVDSIRHSIYWLEAIELTILSLMVTLVLGLMASSSFSTTEDYLVVMFFMMCSPIVVLIVWGLYVALSRENTGCSMIWLGIITVGIVPLTGALLDINRLIVSNLFYRGETPIVYYWSPDSVKRFQEWDKTQKAAKVQQVADTGGVPVLIYTLRTGAITEKIFAATTLGKQGDSRAVEPLIATLKFNKLEWAVQTILPQIPVKVAAATALGQLADTRAVEPLITTLRNENVPLAVTGFTEPLRVAAANALGNLCDVRAIEPLKVALQDKNVNIQAAAKVALERLEKLIELKESLDAGLSTIEEYEAKKADILLNKGKEAKIITHPEAIDYKTCLKCRSSNPRNAKVCESCGAKFV